MRLDRPEALSSELARAAAPRCKTVARSPPRALRSRSRKLSVVVTRRMLTSSRGSWPKWTSAAGDVGAGVVATRVPAWLRHVSKERPKSQRGWSS